MRCAIGSSGVGVGLPCTTAEQDPDSALGTAAFALFSPLEALRGSNATGKDRCVCGGTFFGKMILILNTNMVI